MKKRFESHKINELSEIKVKHEEISKYLLNLISGCKIKHKHGSDANTVVFIMDISGVTKELIISDQYLQDCTIIEIFDFINKKEVIRIISTHSTVKIIMREGYPAISYR
ncbi:MAG: hypothetical protein ABIR84_00770 [Candidatus Nitrotoga sp.]